jgi:hypothetical protein
LVSKSAKELGFPNGGGIAGDPCGSNVVPRYGNATFILELFLSNFRLNLVMVYSGAVPNEKITWGKLDINTPKFIIESDATL